MLRTLRFVIVVIFGLALMLMISANMAPVELRLLPTALGVDAPSRELPLAVGLVLALLGGLILGLLIEFARESKHRRNLESKRAELARLREQNQKLVDRLGEDARDLDLLAS